MAERTEKSHRVSGISAAPASPAHERVNDDVIARAGRLVLSKILQADADVVAATTYSHDPAQAEKIVAELAPQDRERVKTELQESNQFDSLPIHLQYMLSPTSPFHQAHQVDKDGAISCTTAVRIEGVTADEVLAVLKHSWQPWWATSTVSDWKAAGAGGGPSFKFIPESTLKGIPGFHLQVDMAPEIKQADGYRLPAQLVGSFTGEAEMYIQSVDGGVVVHDSWMNMRLQNWAMEHLGGPGFWTGGHLSALVGGMGMGLGATGFAGLREYMLARRNASTTK
jgi:hypothetical protein